VAPLPPLDLAGRVGPLNPEDPFSDYLGIGAAVRAHFDAVLGPDWSWEGKTALDFGCGAGRVLRHYLPEAAAGADFHGCDVDVEAIVWLQTNLSPPFHAFVNLEQPPLDRPDSTFDVIFAASVFTHIASGWAEWLLEMHRVLKPGGLLIASYLGAGMADLYETVTGDPYDEELVGMDFTGAQDPYVHRNVFHSPWWIRAHWARAFDITELRTSGFANPEGEGHGLVMMRPLPDPPTPAELAEIEPGEPREFAALLRNRSQLYRRPL
jgi:SAM-dependent methyltransferase